MISNCADLTISIFGHALNPARPSPEKPGRDSLITGPARLQLSAQVLLPQIRPGPARCDATARRL